MRQYFWLVALVLLGGCLTTQKATNYLRDKNKLSEVCEQNYPTPIVSTDSTEYKFWLNANDSLKNAFLNLLDSSSGEISSLRQKVGFYKEGNQYSIDSCDAAVTYYGQRLTKIVDSMSLIIKNKVKPAPPIVIYRIDSTQLSFLHDQLKEQKDLTTKAIQNEQKVQAEKDSVTSNRKWWRWAAISTWALILVFLIGYIYAKTKK